MTTEKKVHAVNGETGRTFCGRDPKSVNVSNGQTKVTCSTCLRVVGNAINKQELLENTKDLTGGYLQHRIPDLCTEVRFMGLADHHLDAIDELIKITGPLPTVDEDIDVLDEVQMVGVANRLANIKMEFQSAWAIVRTVRGKQCPKDMLKYRDNTDEEIAGLALHQSIKRGLCTLEDISWAHHVSLKFGEPTSSLDEENMKMWEENKKRDRQMASNGIEYQDPSINVELDDPIDRPAPIGKEAKFTTEGDFGQVQITAPNDLKSEDGLYFDLWAEERTNKFDNSIYLDPQARTRSAILGAVRELLHQRAYKVRGHKLVWKLNGLNGPLSAAAMRGGKSDKAPWKVAIPMEMVYRHMGYKDDHFQEMLNATTNAMFPRPEEDCKFTTTRWTTQWHLPKNPNLPWAPSEDNMTTGAVWVSQSKRRIVHILHEETKGKSSGGRIKGKLSFRVKQRMIRMWHVLKQNAEFMPKHLIINIWIHKDEDWRVALGLPPVSAAERKPTKVRPQTCFPPQVKGYTLVINGESSKISDETISDGIRELKRLDYDVTVRDNTITVLNKITPINGSTDGQLPQAAG